MKFRVSPHYIREGVQVCEVFDDSGRFIATVVAGPTDREIRVISKYMTSAELAPPSAIPIPAAVILLGDKPD